MGRQRREEEGEDLFLIPQCRIDYPERRGCRRREKERESER